MNQATKIALIIGGVLVVLLIVQPLLGGLWGPQGGGYGMMGPGMMGGFGGFMPFVGILFWVLIIAGVVALVGGLGQSRSSEPPSGRADSPLEILNRRYARGDITKEEYEGKKRDLA